MSGAFTGNGFSGSTGGGWPGSAIWDGLEQLRGQLFDRTTGVTDARRDVRAALLVLLSEGPLTGAQVIREIEQRSASAWKPTPGAVYPTLQLLVDEGLAATQEVDDRTSYLLTDEGRRAASAITDTPAPWDGTGVPLRASALPKAGIDLAQATALVARSGSPEQIEHAVAVLEEARRKLFSILAKD